MCYQYTRFQFAGRPPRPSLPGSPRPAGSLSRWPTTRRPGEPSADGPPARQFAGRPSPALLALLAATRLLAEPAADGQPARQLAGRPSPARSARRGSPTRQLAVCFPPARPARHGPPARVPAGRPPPARPARRGPPARQLAGLEPAADGPPAPARRPFPAGPSGSPRPANPPARRSPARRHATSPTVPRRRARPATACQPDGFKLARPVRPARSRVVATPE